MANPTEITPDWPTKAELAKRLGKSVSAVVRLQTEGRLHPRLDEDGVNRYDPIEVADVLANPTFRTSLDRKEEFAEYELGVVKQIIDMVAGPREKIDNLMFRMLERQEAQIVTLLGEREKDRLIVETAKDATAERQAAMMVVNTEQQVKREAASRIMATIQNVVAGITGNGGVQLTTDQLQELIIAGDFLTPEQTKSAQASIAAHTATLKVAAEKAKQALPKKEEPPQDDMPTKEAT